MIARRAAGPIVGTELDEARAWELGAQAAVLDAAHAAALDEVAVNVVFRDAARAFPGQVGALAAVVAAAAGHVVRHIPPGGQVSSCTMSWGQTPSS